MSGIYIPGMKMPKDGEMLVLCVGYNGKVLHPIEFATEDFLFAETGKTAIELPPHGRVIDADRLFLAMFQCTDGSIIGDKDIDGWPYEARYADIKRFIRQAPTIIPPEGGADE